MGDSGSRYNDRHLTAEALVSSDPDSLLESQYDFILTGTSWDERCLTLTETDVSANVICIIEPSNVGTSGLRAKSDQRVHQWASKACDQVVALKSASEHVEDLYEAAAAQMTLQRKRVDRPLRVLVDLSAAVRYVTLGTVALALNDGIADFVDVLYAEAEYGDVLSQATIDREAMMGSWEALAIPGLEGDWYPARPRHFLVSAGFNSDKAARLAERWDPDFVTVLLPSPGLKPEYEEATDKANAPWMKRFRVDDARKINSPPADAIGTWKALSSASKLDPARDNIYGLLCGSKPHALAITLWALARQTPAVLYVRPAVHTEQRIVRNGKYWRYRVWDRTLVPTIR